MITVKRLKELLEKVPNDAMVYAYEGEDTGICIYTQESVRWWIRAHESNEIDGYTDGFEE